MTAKPPVRNRPSQSPFTPELVQQIVDYVGPVASIDDVTDKLDPISLKETLDRAYRWYYETEELVQVVLALAPYRDEAKSVCQQLVSVGEDWAEMPINVRQALTTYEHPSCGGLQLDRRLIQAALEIACFLKEFRWTPPGQKWVVMPLQEFTYIVSGYWEENVAARFSWTPVKTTTGEYVDKTPALRLIWRCAPYLIDHPTIGQCSNAIKHVRHHW